MTGPKRNWRATLETSGSLSAGVVLANLLLGHNIFRGGTSSESRERVISHPIPDFQELSPNVNERLNEILRKTLHRDVDERYQSADELLHDLEHYLYHGGYGPTNETLGRHARELFGQIDAGRAVASKSDTVVIRHK